MLCKKIAALAMPAVVAVGIIAAAPGFGSPAHAQQSEKGLKDIYANYFRIGTCYPYQQVNDAALRNVILREFNSLTHENDLKPYATMVRNGSTDDNIAVQLNNNARIVMAVCTTYNIPLRGHTLVWHQQTPSWFFFADMQSGNQNSRATAAVMNRRMESYIKNIFELIKKDFPKLDLYAYDVVNEIYSDSGKARAPGGLGDANSNNSTDQSPWVQIYGNNSFADTAFVYARRHTQSLYPNIKLFYNDFNEYHPNGKRDSIAAMAARLGPKGRKVLDGIGMQSHLSTGWPDIGTYKTALTKFIGVEGVEIHVTELDITIESSGGTEAKQAEVYESVFQAYKEAREAGANITSVSIWGVRDDLSWRNDRNPLLFTSNYTKKPAYNAVAALIPEKNWGDGKNPQFNTPPPDEVKADENGFFFYHNFEDNTTMKWARRGDANIANTTAQKNSGTRSVLVSNRNQNWNGAIFSLPDREFKAGTEYSFSVMARHDGNETKTISLSFQYNNPAGTESYDNVAAAEAAPGQWVQIANTSYKIPDGSNFSIYVELSDNYTSFYFDDAMGGVKGTTIKPDGTPGEPGTAPVMTSKNTAAGKANLVTLRGKTLSVNAPAASKVKVRVVNLSGKTVANFNTKGGSSLSLRKLPAGAYIVEAKMDGRKTAQPVVLR
ncbi:MAG: endo-1,4-beta-xylanase [Chitinispirillia bacterium]|nr:endo-1,4-beta-xylanase [Chitinispirillia bacterium]MCL2242212.1 endo-1,4-beta-xylanase [Chitinispirillia bacterium]